MTEDLPQRPINPYGESRLMFEKMLTCYRQIHGLEFVTFRYFNAAGASEKFGEHHRIETHLIPNVLKVALGQKPHAEIYGTCIGDYIHIADLARAYILGLAPGQQGFYNLGNGDGYSVREVIATCEKVSGRKIPVAEKPRRPGGGWGTFLGMHIGARGGHPAYLPHEAGKPPAAAGFGRNPHERPGRAGW